MQGRQSDGDQQIAGIALKWTRYPAVAQYAPMRSWIEALIGKRAPRTVDLHARALNRFLLYLNRNGIPPEEATPSTIAAFVEHLQLPVKHPFGRPRADGHGLAANTIELYLLTLRMYFGTRWDNPAKPVHAATRRIKGTSEKHQQYGQTDYPVILTDVLWRSFLQVLRDNTLRNVAMLLLLYDGALRPHDIVTLQMGDIYTGSAKITSIPQAAPMDLWERPDAFLFEGCRLTVRAPYPRVLPCSDFVSELLMRYMRERVMLSPGIGEIDRYQTLFVSEGRRASDRPLNSTVISHLVGSVAKHIAEDSPSTDHATVITANAIRSSRLAHLARAGHTAETIAAFVGHTSPTRAARLVAYCDKKYCDRPRLDLKLVSAWMTALFINSPDEPTLFMQWSGVEISPSTVVKT